MFEFNGWFAVLVVIMALQGLLLVAGFAQVHKPDTNFKNLLVLLLVFVISPLFNLLAIFASVSMNDTINQIEKGIK